MWYLVLIALWSFAAASVSWHLAAKQGRNAQRWSLWTLLFAGLPLIWLIMSDLFRLPKFGTPVGRISLHICCEKQSWAAVADFGHAGGVDLDLGKCENCGAYLMAVSYTGPTTYVVISNERAEEFLKLQGTPELKKALKHWVD